MKQKRSANLTYTNLFLFVVVIIGIIFIAWKPVQSYHGKAIIKNHTSISNLSEVYSFCKNIDSNEKMAQCQNEKRKYEYLASRFNALIDGKDHIDCSDFSDSDEARQFYEYVGGMNIWKETDLSIKYGNELFRNYLIKEKNTFDPYDLDADNDRDPCENTNYE